MKRILLTTLAAILLIGVVAAYPPIYQVSPPYKQIPPQAYKILPAYKYIPQVPTIKPDIWIKPHSEGGEPTPTPPPTPIPTLPPVPKPYIYVKIGYSSAKAGDTVVLTGEIMNEGKDDVTVKLVPISNEWYGQAIKPEWVSVDPAELNVPAGESAQFKITVSIPEDAAPGYYRGSLAIRPENYAEVVEDYAITVYRLLNEPVTEEFYVPQNTSSINISVTWNCYNDYNMPSGNLTVHLYNPTGEEVAPTAKYTHISGFVYAPMGSPFGPPIEILPGTLPGTPVPKNRKVYTDHKVMYDLPNPACGTWKLEMIPEYLRSFRYDIYVNPV